ncbi:LOG family protein [Occallatibacter riparius]|uniref:AMP nucleosidase n=1 Tax=Occallatibacter riparius TaxID=1002689 RepID=A0A9J7BWQ9_9BACT|nr:TIGR00730 family Rossman fold protein [Occallatibacter riparius]UWZ87088.1 TIGR00730 family Rossman fold protein [Occallatibacter riparius]
MSPPPLERAPLAYENPTFLNSADGRLIRILAEYTEPLARFRREQIQDTVVFFGSARFRGKEEADHALELLDKPGATKAAPSAEQPATIPDIVEGKASNLQRKRAVAAVEMARYYEDARRLAFMLTQWAKTIPSRRHRFVVTSGGGPGIMEAANRGAHEAGGKTIGLNIRLPFEQAPNPYITPSLNFEFHYFFMRKLWFAYLSKALVVFPGGFGTIDEMFEILTLTQTEKLAKKITVVVYGSDYWKRVFNIQALVDTGAISPDDVALFQFADTPEEAFECLKQGLTENYLIPEAAGSRRPEVSTDPELLPGVSIEEILPPDVARTRR